MMPGIAGTLDIQSNLPGIPADSFNSRAYE